MSKPYYEHAGITIYHGDCRQILPQLEQPLACIVDPVWPNSVFPGVADPQALFAEAAALLAVQTLVVHLGCTSDPRFLSAVPNRYPFLRTCWMRYARPSYRGRVLVGSDVAYVFGEAPKSRAQASASSAVKPAPGTMRISCNTLAEATGRVTATITAQSRTRPRGDSST